MNLRILIISLLSLSFLPCFADTGSKEGGATFTLGGGYLFFSQKRDLQNTAIDGMAALAYNFSDNWAMEFAADLINANSGDPSKHHVHGFAYILDALYRFPIFHTFEPYVLGGFNVISLKPISSEPVNQGGMNIGVGTQFFKSSHIALSLEARDLYTFSGGKSDILLNGGVNFIWE